MSTDFASEHKTPGNRFRPGPGQAGTAAGMRAGKTSGGSPRPSRQAAPDARRGGGLGLPAMSEKSDSNGDHRHLVLLSQHHNMKDLGRDQPFGIHAINNGDFRQILPPGMNPFDWFLDT